MKDLCLLLQFQKNLVKIKNVILLQMIQIALLSEKKRVKNRKKVQSQAKKSSSKKKSRKRTPSPSSQSSSDSSVSSREEQQQNDRHKLDDQVLADLKEIAEKDWASSKEHLKVNNNDDVFVGPQPMVERDATLTERDYGGALLAGEGSAMAAYLQSGKRIPRRGEIGLLPEEIEDYENVGFVMSGNRHRRMNAVRIRKENQVISAEEKNALLMFNQEQKLKKDTEIIGNFKEMLSQKLRAAEDARSMQE